MHEWSTQLHNETNIDGISILENVDVTNSVQEVNRYPKQLAWYLVTTWIIIEDHIMPRYFAYFIPSH